MLHHEEFQSFCRDLACGMHFCIQCHQINIPESMKKNSGVHINFVKIASFVFAENEVCEHTKHQPFSSLFAALAVTAISYIFVYLMTTLDMGNSVSILCLSENVRKIKPSMSVLHIFIMVLVHNQRYRIGLLSM